MNFAGNLGNKMHWLVTNPLGEEVLEGTTGGLIAGASQLGSDQPLEQTALETAAAIGGGIGIGMLGRRFGARIGKRIRPEALLDQEGMLATVGRTVGSETTLEGVKSQAATMKNVIQESLVNSTSAHMLQEAIANPIAFAGKYGIDATAFQEALPLVQKGRTAAGMIDAVGHLPPAQRERVMEQLKDYVKVENLITAETANNMDALIRRTGDRYKDVEIEGVPGKIGPQITALLNPTVPITGEHMGRAAGRILGDEIGILGGLAAGSVLASALGMESPKDRRIRELENQLGG